MKEKTENLLRRWVVFLKGYWGVSGGNVCVDGRCAVAFSVSEDG